MQKSETQSGDSRINIPWLLAMVFNPLILPPALFSLLAFHSGALPAEVRRVTLVAMVLYFVIPGLYLIALQASGRISTIEARDRERRSTPLMIGAVYLIIVVPLMWAQAETSTTIVTSFALITAANAFIIAFITRWFKISMHVASVAGFFAVLQTVNWITGEAMAGGFFLLISAAVLIPIIMWARIADDAHSKKEVFSGLLFGIIILPLELGALHTLGIIF